MAKLKPIEQLAEDINKGDLVQFQTRSSEPFTGHYMGTSTDGKFLLFGFTRFIQTPSFKVDKYKWHHCTELLLRYDEDTSTLNPKEYKIIQRAKKR